MMARLDNLGGFHIFFTLSCAEMRWDGIMGTILQQEDASLEVIFDGDNNSVLINGKPLDDYLKCSENCSEKCCKKCISRSKLVCDHVFLVTRMFDHRVKMFIKHIVMKGTETNGLLPVDYYTYRVEFQSCRMPHIHGCLWLNESFLKPYRDVNDPTAFDDNKVILLSVVLLYVKVLSLCLYH